MGPQPPITLNQVNPQGHWGQEVSPGPCQNLVDTLLRLERGGWVESQGNCQNIFVVMLHVHVCVCVCVCARARAWQGVEGACHQNQVIH